MEALRATGLPGVIPKWNDRHEEYEDAAERYGLTVKEVSQCFWNRSLVWDYNPVSGRWELVGDPPPRPWRKNPSFKLWKAVWRYIMNPDTFWEMLTWGLMMPVTLPLWVMGCIGMSIKDAIVSAKGEYIPVHVGGDYGGGGLFDEVSTRRREELQYLFGIGKYAD